MTLRAFLGSLNTENIKAIIFMGNVQVCTIYAYGVEALDERYKFSEVISWEITDKTTIKVNIEENLSA